MRPGGLVMTMRIPHRAALAALSLGALLSACGAGGGPAASPTPTAQPTPAPTAQTTPAPTAQPTPTPSPTATAPPATASTSVFLIKNGKTVPVRRVVSTATPATDSINELLNGVSAAESLAGMTTDVPRTTRFNGVSIAGAVATVDFSQDFTAGPADSQARRVTQVVDTLTEFGSVRSVLFRIDGKAVTRLGGIALSSAVTRADVEDWQPAILVEAPTFNQTVSSPLRIWGTANTFEAVFRIRMWTQDGAQLFDDQVHATSGTGTRGTFDVTVRFTATGPAVLEAYEVSMKDGSHVNVVDIPLTLQP